ncbi:hemerythrin HHE cation-binding protein [Paraburkholderia lacunae]|uniref:Hemerythrin HHE cation-binding protein n=2 Tax=Paraburkholderia lacunae TaxID=2211104 RepID=A0A370N2J2_9BURK|nr:hemerythrin domain-containing protein [Paraburkholderia lacunae]RDJ99826.1 hemerythrin HHE cation-binding protein [Paraburkholderia lacunae]
MTSFPVLHASPGAGFDEPFDMLTACHEKAERMLILLERLARHLEECGADADAAQAARDITRYFDVAGPAHHEDEERHLFPALTSQGLPARTAIIEKLQREHLTMSEQWKTLRIDLDQLVAGRWPVNMSTEAFGRWATFAALYRGHIAAEETQVYPAARQLLDDTARDAMGCEMAQRRGVRWHRSWAKRPF